MKISRVIVCVAALGALVGGCGLLWMAMAPGATDFAPGQRVALANYRGGSVSGVPPELARSDIVTRGEYLTRAADCAACHTVAGGKPFSGGFAFKLPFGTLYSANITPDPETGIGAWSDDEFVRAVREGVGRRGERLYPAFPFASYTALTRDDILAIKAYLSSVNAVRYTPPENSLMFPFNQRWLLGTWSLLFNPNRRFEPSTSQSSQWNRGAYVAEGLAHCSECHTPRNLAQGLDHRRKFEGTLVDGWYAYNISSNAKSGIGAWSDAELAQYLSSGHAEGHGTASGSMAEAIANGLKYLAPGDIDALVTYVRSVPASDSHDIARPFAPVASMTPKDGKSFTGDGSLGRQLFESSCVSCHSWAGTGAVSRWATLTGARSVNDPLATNVVQIILSGSVWKSADGRAVMPAFGAAYTDGEIAALANYVTARFGAHPSTLAGADVARLRKNE